MQLNEQITQAIWELLRGKHIDLDHRHFSIIKENEEVFIQHVNALGYQFLSSDLGFYYLQRDGKKEETQTSSRFCCLFFVTVQRLDEIKDTDEPLDLNYLLNRKGFDLEALLNFNQLDDTLKRMFRDVELTSNEKIGEVLNKMSTMHFTEKLENGNWRFRRPIARLVDTALKYADMEEEE